MKEEKLLNKMAFERIYTIPIRRKAIHAPRWKRAKKASSVVKEFLFKHTKHSVAVSNWINEEIWARGSRSPPSKIGVKVFEREGKYFAELVELPKRAQRIAKVAEEKEKILGEKAKKIQEQQEAIAKQAEETVKAESDKENKGEEKTIEEKPVKEKKGEKVKKTEESK